MKRDIVILTTAITIVLVLVGTLVSGCGFLLSSGSMTGYGASEEGQFTADEVHVFITWDYTWIREDGRPRFSTFTPNSLIVTDSIWGKNIESVEEVLAKRINETKESSTHVLMVQLKDDRLLLIARGRTLKKFSRDHIKNVYLGKEKANQVGHWD